MPAFDALDFVTWLAGRWKVVAISCIIAITAAGVITVVQPRRYTATATVAIQPPAGNDPRAALAISPVYLESLKSYERFASGDAVFQRALSKVTVHEAGTASPDALRKQVLKVSKPSGMALLEISASLKDAREAQALAYAVAQEAARPAASEIRTTLGTIS